MGMKNRTQTSERAANVLKYQAISLALRKSISFKDVGLDFIHTLVKGTQEYMASTDWIQCDIRKKDTKLGVEGKGLGGVRGKNGS